MRLGLLLPNQGVVFGAVTIPEMMAMAEAADSSEIFDSLFVGDNLLAKHACRAASNAARIVVAHSTPQIASPVSSGHASAGGHSPTRSAS